MIVRVTSQGLHESVGPIGEPDFLKLSLITATRHEDENAKSASTSTHVLVVYCYT